MSHKFDDDDDDDDDENNNNNNNNNNVKVMIFGPGFHLQSQPNQPE